jgi:hypothetical protein
MALWPSNLVPEYVCKHVAEKKQKAKHAPPKTIGDSVAPVAPTPLPPRRVEECLAEAYENTHSGKTWGYVYIPRNFTAAIYARYNDAVHPPKFFSADYPETGKFIDDDDDEDEGIPMRIHTTDASFRRATGFRPSSSVGRRLVDTSDTSDTSDSSTSSTEAAAKQSASLGRWDTPGALTQDAIHVRLDQSNQQIALYITTRVTEAFSGVIALVPTLSKVDLPVRLESPPVYGQTNPKFTDFIAPGMIICIACR